MNRIILSGCNGAMGRAIFSCADKNQEQIVQGIDKNSANLSLNTVDCPSKCNVLADVVIDFSHFSLFDSVLELCLEKNLPLVCGTTGLTQESHKKMQDASKKIPIFYATNMSWGVYVLNKLASMATKLLHPDFDIEIVEKHHRLKLDSPSGTALTLLKSIQDQMNQSSPVFGRNGMGKRADNEIGVSSVRGGTIIGEHEAIFAGNNEIIRISHSAQSKEIFALGALRASRFLIGKSAGLYNMDDLVSAN